MRRLSRFFATKLDSLAYRLALLDEAARLRTTGCPLPTNVSRLLLSSPARYDDFIQIAAFVGTEREFTLIDIGANKGRWALDFCFFFPKTTCVYCFEPNPELQLELAHAAARLPEHRIFPFALGNTMCDLNLAVPAIDNALATFRAFNSNANAHYGVAAVRTHRVPVRRLDDTLGDLEGPTVVKIDVQGFEAEVIEGAIRTLANCDAVLLECSFARIHADGREPSFSRCSAMLAECGLVPVVFQRFGTEVNTYAFERDVLYVKRELTDRVFHRNVG